MGRADLVSMPLHRRNDNKCEHCGAMEIDVKFYHEMHMQLCPDCYCEMDYEDNYTDEDCDYDDD